MSKDNLNGNEKVTQRQVFSFQFWLKYHYLSFSFWLLQTLHLHLPFFWKASFLILIPAILEWCLHIKSTCTLCFLNNLLHSSIKCIFLNVVSMLNWLWLDDALQQHHSLAHIFYSRRLLQNQIDFSKLPFWLHLLYFFQQGYKKQLPPLPPNTLIAVCKV